MGFRVVLTVNGWNASFNERMLDVRFVDAGGN